MNYENDITGNKKTGGQTHRLSVPTHKIQETVKRFLRIENMEQKLIEELEAFVNLKRTHGNMQWVINDLRKIVARAKSSVEVPCGMMEFINWQKGELKTLEEHSNKLEKESVSIWTSPAAKSEVLSSIAHQEQRIMESIDKAEEILSRYKQAPKQQDGLNKCPECGGMGWYSGTDNRGEQEQVQCERCNCTGHLAPQSSKPVEQHCDYNEKDCPYFHAAKPDTGEDKGGSI